jgi:uncharacterized membrane protein
VTIDTLRRRAERYIRGKLVWGNVYRTTSYVRSALWVIPLLAILLVFLIVPVLRWLDGWLAWRITGLTQAGAQSLFQSVNTLTLSFIVFTFGSLLVAIQVAGGQMTPRIIATALLRNDVVRYSVGLFVFTLMFSIMALNRVERANDIMVVLTGLLGIACTATFLFLIDYAARLLRPVSILAYIADEGLSVIKVVYPAPAGDTGDLALPPEISAATPRRLLAHDGDSGILLAVDLPTLVREARRTDGLIEIVPHVGDFVATGQPLFALYAGAIAIPDDKVQVAVALGSERTMEQDPLFAFRIIVDIGLKALSPAINDPTTGVLALDQVHRLLRFVGRRQLLGETVLDSRGRVRVVYRTPDWEDFVHLSCHEIRMYGAANIQIARRMRAMFDDLIATLPADRHPALELESRLLAEAIRGHYRQPEDLALAQMPDTQGLGGAVSASRNTARR